MSFPRNRVPWGAIDDLILRDDGTEVLYSLTDPNWNVSALLADTGSVLERYRYNAYGERDVQTSAFASRSDTSYTWEYGFTTRRLDSETGCMYYRNRYYHPTLGRFQKRDPIGYEGGANEYLGMFSINSRDPYGLRICKDECDTIGERKGANEPLKIGFTARNREVSSGTLEGSIEATEKLLLYIELCGRTGKVFPPTGKVAGVCKELRKELGNAIKDLEETLKKLEGIVVSVLVKAKCCRKRPCCFFWTEKKWVEIEKWVTCNLGGPGTSTRGVPSNNLDALADLIPRCVQDAVSDDNVCDPPPWE